MMKLILKRLEDIAGKEEILVTKMFFFFLNVFKSFPFQGRLISGLCGEEIMILRDKYFGNFLHFILFFSIFFIFFTLQKNLLPYV